MKKRRKMSPYLHTGKTAGDKREEKPSSRRETEEAAEGTAGRIGIIRIPIAIATRNAQQTYRQHHASRQ